MPDALQRYRKLPGATTNLLGRTRLWQGEDHFLLVSSVAAFETYRRFYFREVKAIVVQPSSIGLIWNIVLGFILFVFAVGAYAFWLTRSGEGVPTGLIIMGALAVVVAIFLLINIVRGKTCRFYVQTKAGTERLGAPKRIAAARRVRNILSPIIREAQAGEAVPAAAPAYPEMPAAGIPQP